MSPNLSTVANASATTFGGSASNVSTLMNNTVKLGMIFYSLEFNLTPNLQCILIFIFQTPPANTGSANNLSVAKDRSPNVSTNHIAPPLPPHRPPPPPTRGSSIVWLTLLLLQMTLLNFSDDDSPTTNFSSFILQTPNSNNTNINTVAPPVPQRHSSMRNSNGAQSTIVQHQTIVSTVTPNATRTAVTRFVVDLDSKFGHAFHNVTEFPAPSPFTKFEKSYPSRNMKATSGMFWIYSV